MSIEKVHNCRIGYQLVLQFGEPVSFVVKDQEFYRGALSRQGLHQLLRFAQWYAWVVGTVNDHERSSNLVHLRQG